MGSPNQVLRSFQGAERCVVLYQPTPARQGARLQLGHHENLVRYIVFATKTPRRSGLKSETRVV